MKTVPGRCWHSHWNEIHPSTLAESEDYKNIYQDVSLQKADPLPAY